MKSVNELGISPMPWEWDKGVVVCNDGDIEKDVAITVGYDIGIESQETANGRLLAAAPKLYEALYNAIQVTCDCCDFEYDGDECLECPRHWWRDVLAKAAGEEVAK